MVDGDTIDVRMAGREHRIRYIGIDTPKPSTLPVVKSRFLDHSSLAVTTVYLRQLEGDRDTTWQQVAATLGI